MFEEGWQDFCFNVVCFNTIRTTALLYHLTGNKNHRILIWCRVWVIFAFAWNFFYTYSVSMQNYHCDIPLAQFFSSLHQETGTLWSESAWLLWCSSLHTRHPWEGSGNQSPSRMQPGPIETQNTSLVSYSRNTSISVQTKESILDLPFLCVDVYPSTRASGQSQMTQYHREWLPQPKQQWPKHWWCELSAAHPPALQEIRV